jgi:hypothetical protein
VFALSAATPIDHCNVVQLTPPGLLRLYVDTDSFEALGVDAPAAHSEFAACSERGAKSTVRERVLTIDLVSHAKQVALHTSTGADDEAGKNKRGDKRLDRLRWALGRCGEVRMRMLVLDAAGQCLPLDGLPGASIQVVPISPTAFRFGSSKVVRVPRVTDLPKLLPDLSVADQVARAKREAKRTKKDPKVDGSEENKDATEESARPASTSTSFFPLLADGTSAQDVWTDMMTYLGLVHGRMER